MKAEENSTTMMSTKKTRYCTNKNIKAWLEQSKLFCHL